MIHPSTTVHWHDPATELPDDEICVLIALSDGEVATGFHLDGDWHFTEGVTVDQGCGTRVLFWADFPEPPQSL